MLNSILKSIKIVCVAVLAGLTGCSFTHKQQCRDWQNDGKFYGSLQSCIECVDTLGSSNVDAIQGCAVGLDAARLLQS